MGGLSPPGSTWRQFASLPPLVGPANEVSAQQNERETYQIAQRLSLIKALLGKPEAPHLPLGPGTIDCCLELIRILIQDHIFQFLYIFGALMSALISCICVHADSS